MIFLSYFSHFFDKIDHLEKKGIVERYVISFALIAFLIHLLYITTQIDIRHILEPRMMQNYIAAIATPFTVLLFYEVYLMIMILPESIHRSVGKQYELVTLITLNQAFKHLSIVKLEEFNQNTISSYTELLVILISSIVMFLLTAVYYKIARNFSDYAAPNLSIHYVQLKKTVSLGLLTVFTMLLLVYLFNVVTGSMFFYVPKEVLSFVFSLMVFVDVFFLFVALVYTSDFGVLFTDIAFVLLSILFRFAIAYENNWEVLLLKIGAMMLGILAVSVRRFVWDTKK